MSEPISDVHKKYVPHPDAEDVTRNFNKGVDYEPYPEQSLKILLEHEAITKSIIDLYSGSCSEQDMQVYDGKAIYDDPYSYCGTRYKIAGQWYGLPKILSNLRTVKTQVVSDSADEIVFRLRQEYTLKGLGASKRVDSLVSLGLDKDGKVKYHKDMWNEKDYSHQGRQADQETERRPLDQNHQAAGNIINIPGKIM